MPDLTSKKSQTDAEVDARVKLFDWIRRRAKRRSCWQIIGGGRPPIVLEYANKTPDWPPRVDTICPAGAN